MMVLVIMNVWCQVCETEVKRVQNNPYRKTTLSRKTTFSISEIVSTVAMNAKEMDGKTTCMF